MKFRAEIQPQKTENSLFLFNFFYVSTYRFLFEILNREFRLYAGIFRFDKTFAALFYQADYYYTVKPTQKLPLLNEMSVL